MDFLGGLILFVLALAGLYFGIVYYKSYKAKKKAAEDAQKPY